jgi:HK97 family phage major capsid protein
VENVIVRSEPLTYREGGAYSFFRDLTQAEMGDTVALARLQRHQRETAVETRIEMPEGVEVRVNPNTTVGTGGEFAVPVWLVDRFAAAVSAGRPLADLCQPLPLPHGASSIHIPRNTTGALAGPTSDGAPVGGTDFVSVDASSNVVTISSQVDVSQQLMDRSPAGFDAYAYVELVGAYNQALELQMINGLGTGNQLLGVTKVSSITSIDGSTVTGADATHGINLLWPFLGKAAAGVGNARLYPPEVWLMAPRRWFWITSQVDGQSRPILVPGQNPEPAEYMPAGGASPVGPVLGLPVYLDGAIPAGATADVAICLRPSDMLLFESEPHFMASPQSLGGTLQVRLSLHKYAAFIPHRYPSAIGKVTGMPQPSGF